LGRNRTLVDKMVEQLVKDRFIRQAEFEELVSMYGKLDDPLPSPIEVRERELAIFQETMIAQKRSVRG